MKREMRRMLALILCVIMMLGTAPLSGFVGLEWPEIDLPKLHLHLPKLQLPDVSSWFAVKASAEDDTSGTCGDNLTWSFDTSTNTLTISGTGAMSDYSSSSSVTTAPWKAYANTMRTVVIDNGVTSIGKYAFYNCSGLTSVTISDSVTSIGDSAFRGCNSLMEMTLPFVGKTASSTGYSGVFGYIFGYKTSSSSSAQSGCVFQIYPDYQYYHYYIPTSLRKVTITKATKIQYNAFYNCSFLMEIHLPDSVTSISNYAFYNCAGLISITIPGSVTSIGDYSFYNCAGLISITIPDSVTSIGENAFFNTGYYNNEANWDSGVLFIDHHLINARATLSGTYTIRPGTVSIAHHAFSGCTGLTSVTIPDSVTSFGYAFYGCTGLVSVTIEDGVTSISVSAFRDCTGLTSVTIPDSVTSIGKNAFYNTGYYNNNANWDSGVLYIDHHLINARTTLSGTYAIRPGTVSIANYAFSGCTGLTSVTIPDSVTSIGYAFSGCTGLTSVTIPDSITSIGSSAFSGCTGLTSVTIPGSITSIGSSAFSECTGLTSVVIPDGVTSIGSSAFYNCSGLTSVTIPDSVTSIGDSAFRGCNSLTEMTLPFVGKTASSAGVSGVFGYIFGFTSTNYAGTIRQGSGYYYIPTSLRKVTITKATKIQYNAFYNCSFLTEIHLPDSVTSIGSHAFYFCTGLSSVTIPNSVTSIGSSSFCYCTGLTSVVIPDGVTSIGGYAFYGCTSLTSVTIGNGVTSIGEDAFYDCTGLTSAQISDLAAWCRIGFNDVGSNPLYYAHHLFLNGTEVAYLVIPNSITSIDNYAFCNCTGLASVTIEAGVTSIGKKAFSGCTDLTSVTIPDSVTSIDNYAFNNCTQLKHIYYRGNVSQWSNISIGSGNPALTNAINYASYDASQNATWIHYNASVYQLSFDSDGGSAVPSTSAASGDPIDSPIPTKTGYTFLGWSPNIMPDHDTTVIACWQINEYTITYDVNGGSEVPSFTGFYGDPVPVPDNPTREGYTFTGWSQTIPATVPAQNLTITANWQINQYQITFNSRGGTSKSPLTVTFGNTFSLPSNPTRSGYIFSGWLWSTADGTMPATMPARDLTAYALWAKSGHKHDNVIIVGANAPTCTMSGFSGQAYCPSCQEYLEEDPGEVIPATGHSFKDVTVRNATCTEDGVLAHRCSRCGEQTTEAIPATGHSRTTEAITTQPTCTELGSRTVTCHCGHSWEEPIAPLGHSYGQTVVSTPTCTTDGLIHYVCANCGDEYDGLIPMLGHQIVTEAGQTPTCTEGGIQERSYCVRCGTVFSENTPLPPLGHDFQTEWVRQPTCTSSGIHYQRCSRCGLYEANDGNAVPYGEDVALAAADYASLESPHPYPNKTTQDYPFSYPDAVSYELKFSSASEFEDGYDFLYILDAEGNTLGTYTGTVLQNLKVTVDSSAFTIRIVSDKSDNAYGFALTSLTVSTRGDLKVTDVPALGHDYAQVTLVASTCKKQGEYALRCTRCGGIELEDPTDLSPVESTADPSTYPESPHNYSNDEVYRYHFTYPGATQLTLHFSPDCELENSFDYLYLYDGSGAQIGKYTGTVLRNKTVVISGDSFSIKMTTDWWITKYGFSFSSIDVTTNGTIKRYQKPLAPHDYFHSVTVAPTPLETGLMTHICRNCGSSYTTVMPRTLYNVGEIVTYGSYPQSRVTDNALISALSRQPLTWKSYGYFSGDGSTDEGIINGNMAPDRYMWYADLNYGGERYRAVTFSKYRPIATGAVAATVGTYSVQDNNGYGLNHVYWFKYDPIQWRVLDPTRGLVVSETVLDAQAYNNYVIYFLLCFFNDPDYEHFANDYVNSSIRYWLNHDFYNTAFTDEQKANVLDTTIHNLSYETLCGEAKGTPYDGETVTDKVFLLAYDDVVNNADYQFSSAQGASATRRASATDYARSQGVAVAANGSSVWYLRTATEWSAFTCMVGYEGDLHITDDDKAMFVGATAIGIRPALRLKNITPNGGEVVEGPVHTVTYMVGNQQLGQLSIAAGAPMVLLGTSAPAGYAFSGWDAPEEMPDHDLTLTSNYLPIYTATFVADGVTVGTAEFTTASGTLYEPAVPEKNGFTGVWESYNLQNAAGDITINAVYETIPCDHVDANSDGVCDSCGEQLTYTKAIIVDGVNLGTVSYTYGATELQDLPDVPAKVGYTGQWDYTISGSELSILPVYAPITYYATFIADGVQVGERVPFTVESTSIPEPAIPAKSGYSAHWRSYSLGASDITITAEYSVNNSSNGQRIVTLQQLLEMLFARFFEAFRLAFVRKK